LAACFFHRKSEARSAKGEEEARGRGGGQKRKGGRRHCEDENVWTRGFKKERRGQNAARRSWHEGRYWEEEKGEEKQ